MLPSKANPLCQRLSEGDVIGFNHEAEKMGGKVDLSGCDLRGLDLRQARLKAADLRGAYLRDADLRGADLSEALLDGASFNHAKISGVLFPPTLPPEEIRLSVEYGTRLRLKP
jgi:uncharacterized protein YjbI with pentapeptide repeats